MYHVPTIRQLRYALAVREAGGISLAARRLGLSAATVSAQITQLERTLETQLFRRTAAGLFITEAGRRLDSLARPAIDELAHALRRARSGTLRSSEEFGVALRLAPPGSTAREAAGHLAILVARTLPHLAVQIISLSAAAPAPDSGLLLDAGSSSGALRDRWVLVGPKAAGPAVALPVLHPHHVRSAHCLARASDLSLVAIEAAPNHLDDLERPWRSRVLLPSLLLPGWLRGERADLEFLDECADDPTWDIELCGNDRAEAGAIGLRGQLLNAVTSLIGQAGAAVAPPRPPSLLGVEREELDCLVAAWRHANMTRAAAELGITQPAASMRLRKLESAVARRLFDRHTHGLSPTPAGTQLAEVAEGFGQVLQRLRPMLAALRRPGPILRAGLLPALNEASLLAEAAAKSVLIWSQRFPQDRLQLIEGRNEDLRRQVLSGAVDFALVDKDDPQAGLTVRSIMRESLVAVASATTDDLPIRPITFPELVHLPLVLPGQHHGLRAIIERGAKLAGVVLAPQLEIDSLAVLMRLIKAGGWVTLLPPGAVRAAPGADRLRMCSIIDPAIERSLSVIRRHGEPLAAPALAFIDVISATLATMER